MTKSPLGLQVTVLLLVMVCNKLIQGYYTDQESADETQFDLVTVHHVSPDAPRFKRSANQMPEELHLDLVTSQQETVNFLLKRISQRLIEFDVYRIRKRRLQTLLLPDLSKTIALYSDHNHRALFKVKERADGDYTIDGDFIMKGSHHHVTPATGKDDVGFSLSRNHNLTKIDFKESLKGDVFYPPNEIMQLGKIRKTVRHPIKSTKYIELAIVTDYPLYERFLAMANNEVTVAQTEMAIYYGYLAASINYRFSTITDHEPDVTVEVYLKSLTICDNKAECSFSSANVISNTDKVNYQKALGDFRSYSNKWYSPCGDHRMFITGHRMARADGATGVIGVAYLSSVCTSHGVSMVQDRYSGVTSLVAAHELGHSLSAQHDNHQSSVGCKNNHYIMNSYASFPRSQPSASNPYFFSNCSAAAIARYVQSNAGSCTDNRPTSVSVSDKQSGQYMNADVQCTIYYGLGSRFCRGTQKNLGFDQMCIRLSCSIANDPYDCRSVVPLPGTSCGNRKWCQRSQCVDSPEAPPRPDDCPQGDDPSIKCTSDMCEVGSTNATLCCQTCYNIDHPQTVTPSSLSSSQPDLMTTPEMETCNLKCQCHRRFRPSVCFFLFFGD